MHDVSGRRAQLAPLRQFTLHESPFAPMGPCIASLDGIDLDDVDVRTTVSGEVIQEADTRDLIFDVLGFAAPRRSAQAAAARNDALHRGCAGGWRVPGHPLAGARFDLGDGDDQLATDSENADSAGNVLAADGGPGDDTMLVGSNWWVEMSGGSGDDYLSGAARTGVEDSSANGVFLHGGQGSDRVEGSSYSDFLYGGGGTDEILGQDGSDWLTDEDDDQSAADAAPGPDLLDGGDDDGDTVSYRGRRAPVRVDLSAKGPIDGEAGEGDTIVGVESAEGGSGPDRLYGNRRANSLTGGAGRDWLEGRRATDALFPGDPQRQTPATGDRVSCGAGLREAVWDPDGTTLVPRNCEFVSWSRGDHYDPYPKRLADGRLAYSVSCPYLETDEMPVPPCRGLMRLREASGEHRTLAAAVMPLRRWGGELVIPLTTYGRKAATTGHQLRAIVHFHWHTPATRWFAASSQDYSWMIKLKLPR